MNNTIKPTRLREVKDTGETSAEHEQVGNKPGFSGVSIVSADDRGRIMMPKTGIQYQGDTVPKFPLTVYALRGTPCLYLFPKSSAEGANETALTARRAYNLGTFGLDNAGRLSLGVDTMRILPGSDKKVLVGASEYIIVSTYDGTDPLNNTEPLPQSTLDLIVGQKSREVSAINDLVERRLMLTLKPTPDGGFTIKLHSER